MNDEDKDNIKVLDIEEEQNDENQPVNDSEYSDIKNSEILTENQKNAETNIEENKGHEVIHKKEGRLHIYIRQDKYKGELKSKNWVGRLYIDGKQKILSSGTANIDEAIPILEKWFDEVFLSNENKEQPIIEKIEIASEEQSALSSEIISTEFKIPQEIEPVILSQNRDETVKNIEPIELKPASNIFQKIKNINLKPASNIFQKIKNINLKKLTFDKKNLTKEVNKPENIDFKQKIKLLLMNGLIKKLNPEEVIGLEITNEEIIIFQVDNNNKTKPILKKAIFHPTGLAVQKNYTLNVYEISEKIKNIYQQEQIKTNNVSICITSENSIVRIVTIALMTNKELGDVVQNNLFWTNYIQTSDNLEEFSIAHQVISKNDKESTMEVLVVGAKLSDIEIYQSILKQAELNLVSIQIKCFSILDSVHKLDPDTSFVSNQPSAILEFGSNENYLMIINEGKPFITDIFLKEADQQLLSQASDEELQGIMKRFNSQFKQIISEFEIKFEKRIRNIKVSSNLVNLENHLSILKKNFANIEFVLLNPLEKMSLSSEIKDKLLGKSYSSFSSVVGAALYNLTIFPNNKIKSIFSKINLLPELEKFTQIRKINYLSVLGLKSFLVIVFLVYFGKISFSTVDSLSYKMALRQAPALVLELKKVSKQELTLKNELALMKRSLKLTKSVSSNKKINYLVLAQIINSVPSEVKFVSLEYDGYNQIIIKGDAKTDNAILRLITNLNKQKLILQASFSLVLSKVDQKKPISDSKEFKVICIIEGDA